MIIYPVPKEVGSVGAAIVVPEMRQKARLLTMKRIGYSLHPTIHTAFSVREACARKKTTPAPLRIVIDPIKAALLSAVCILIQCNLVSLRGSIFGDSFVEL